MSINTILKGLSVKGEEVKDIEERNEGLEEQLKESQDTSHRLRREKELNRRDYFEATEDTKYSCKREVEYVNEEVEGKISEAKKASEEKVKDVQSEIVKVKDVSENRVRRMKEEAEHREKIYKAKAESEAKILRSEVRKEIESDMTDTVEGLKEDLADANIDEAEADTKAKERLKTIETQDRIINDYRDFIKYVMVKLPEIDLKNFNINVDIPTTTVVNKTEVVKSK